MRDWSIAVLLVCLVPFPVNADLPEVQVRDGGTLYFENVPETPAAVREGLRPFLNIRTAAFAGWLPEGGILIRTRLGETAQIYRVREPGSRREQLTFFQEPVQFASPSADPELNRALLLRDVGGNEDFQLYSLGLDDGRMALLSDGEARHGAVVLSRSGSRAAYYSTRRNGRDWDLYVVDLESGTERKIYRAEGAWMPLEWSPEDDRLLVMNVVSAGESHPYKLDLAEGQIRRLVPEDHVAAYRDLRFGRNASELVVITDAGREFLSLIAVDLESGERRLLADVDWDVTDLDVAPDGNELVYVINRDGFGRLERLDLESGEPLSLPELPAGVVSQPRYSPNGGRVAFNFTSPTVSGDVYSFDLDTGEVARWTYSETGGIPEDRFVAPELIRYPTFDEVDGHPRQIPAWVYRPRNEGPHPVIVEIHGGPEAQRRPNFSANFQYWVNELEAAVVAPNVRGSSGYGKTYLGLDNGYLREDSVRDIGALLEWIAAQPDLDESRVMVYGGSYGGYMVLASIMHFGERLAAGVNVVGISNFVTFLQNTRDYRRDMRRAEYGDERDPEMRAFLEEISPANHPERLNRPLFVIQGLNDPRVPASESEQVIAAMRQAGHNPWYLLARDEGHGFRRQSNREAQHEAVALFIQKHLGDG